jgi:hypothetical protein
VLLVLKPKVEGSEDDCRVLQGELEVGQIYKRKVALRPETQWLWALDGVPEGPVGLSGTGLAATLDDAIAALKERWGKWLEVPSGKRLEFGVARSPIT